MINLNNKTVVATEFLKKKTSILKVSLTLFWLEFKKKIHLRMQLSELKQLPENTF